MKIDIDKPHENYFKFSMHKRSMAYRSPFNSLACGNLVTFDIAKRHRGILKYYIKI